MDSQVPQNLHQNLDWEVILFLKKLEIESQHQMGKRLGKRLLDNWQRWQDQGLVEQRRRLKAVEQDLAVGMERGDIEDIVGSLVDWEKRLVGG